MMRRIFVTGLGAITPLGCTVESFWEGLLAGRSGVARITRFRAEEHPVQIAAEVKDFDPAVYLERKDIIRMDMFTQYAVAAALQAVADSKFNVPANAADRMGVIIGTSIGGLGTLLRADEIMRLRGPAKLSPYHLPSVIPNMATAWVSILLGARGPTSCVTTACSAGAQAIGDAANLIRLGYADCMIAGGAEALIHPLVLGSFAALRALSSRNEQPERASRPFDRLRDGFVIGEGAAALVLEEMEHAQRRGARCYAELTGYGLSSDAYHPTAPLPDGNGAARAMHAALENSHLRPDEVDYVNAHGTSTPANDVSETRAIKSVFGDHAYRVAVSSTKSMVGHLLGAAGAVEAVATVLAVVRQILPPTVNHEVPDPECDLDYVPNRQRPCRVRAALSNTFAFGGTNVVLAFRGPQEGLL